MQSAEDLPAGHRGASHKPGLPGDPSSALRAPSPRRGEKNGVLAFAPTGASQAGRDAGPTPNCRQPGPLYCSTVQLSTHSPAGRGTVEPGWSLGVLAVGCALLSLGPGLARMRNRRVAKVHRFVGYQALESISRGVYRPSSSEIRLIRLSVIPSLSRARRRGNLPAPTATEMRLKKSSGT